MSQRRRKQGIANNLLKNICAYPNSVAWGLISASPYAIRALEYATQRRCDPSVIVKKKILKRLRDVGVPYVDKTLQSRFTYQTACINTNFLLIILMYH